VPLATPPLPPVPPPVPPPLVPPPLLPAAAPPLPVITGIFSALLAPPHAETAIRARARPARPIAVDVLIVALLLLAKWPGAGPISEGPGNE
jgi:hypothetical protein